VGFGSSQREAHRGFWEGAGAMAYRTFKPEFKRRVVEEWRSGQKRLAEICRQSWGLLRRGAFGP